MADYFISDLHLRPERPDINRAFLSFLEQISADAEKLYLLGDIFEAWIGDDAMLPQIEPITTALKQLDKLGCQLFFQHGNRDFLVGPAFAEHIGATLLEEACVIELPNHQSALIMHGDQLCTDDVEYQQFRGLVRSAAWQHEFLAKTLEERVAIAQQLREASKASAKTKSNAIMDVNSQAVVQTFAQYQVPILIHGHTHRPAIHRQQGAAEGDRIVLGDWDTHLWYLRADQQGLELLIEPIEA